MKFISHIIISFTVFMIVVSVFNIPVQPINNSELLSLFVSSAIYTIAGLIASIILVILIFLPVMLIGLLATGNNKGPAMCLGASLLLPLIIVMDVLILRYGHQYVDFFPVFNWPLAIGTSLVTNTISGVYVGIDTFNKKK